MATTIAPHARPGVSTKARGIHHGFWPSTRNDASIRRSDSERDCSSRERISPRMAWLPYTRPLSSVVPLLASSSAMV